MTGSETCPTVNQRSDADMTGSEACPTVNQRSDLSRRIERSDRRRTLIWQVRLVLRSSKSGGERPVLLILMVISVERHDE